MRIASFTLLLMTCVFSVQAQKVKTTIKQSWHGNAWQDTLQETYTYDSRGLLATKTEQRWSTATSGWVNSRLETNTYYPDSLQQQQTIQTWDATADAWQNLEMTTYTHSAPHVCSGWLRQIWASGSWQNERQLLYTNDKKGRPVKELWLTWDAATNAWINKWRSTWTWNSKDKPEREYAENWDTARHTWSKERQDRIHWFYDKSGRSLGNDEVTRINNQWRNNVNAIYSYDGKGYKISMIGQVWDHKTRKWIEVHHEDFTNNADGSVNYLTATRWQKAGGEPVSKVMVKYTYF